MTKRLSCGRMALILALFAVIAGCKPKEQAAPKPPDVEVVAIEARNVPVYREWVGSLSAEVTANMSAQITGYLLRQNYKEGTRVKTGDLLFEIDDRTYQATLEQAQAKLTKTELDVQRYTPLAAVQAISKQELDDAVQANIAAKAAVDAAKLDVNFCKITSPIDGIAGIAKPSIGDLIGPAYGPLTSVTSVDPIRANFAVDQQLMTVMMEKTLAEGKAIRADGGSSQSIPLELTLASGQVYPLKGRVQFADNQLDVRTGTIQVVGEFDNPQGVLVPGMFVRVRAMMDVETNALVVPQRAVTDMQGRSLIAVVGQDNVVTIRPVTVGAQMGQDWVITGDVKVGDRVVAEGIQKVRDGVKVNPLPYGSTSTTNTMQSP